MGGYGDGRVLSDCWLLDVMRGSSEKVIDLILNLQKYMLN